MHIEYLYKRQLTKMRRILQNPGDLKYLRSKNIVKQQGILLVIHESQELGASILALHIAQQLVEFGVPVYIVSRQFGKLNEKYNQVAPLQIALSKRAYRKICKKLYSNGFREALMITVSTGDFVKITKKCGFEVVSMIHELEPVIRMLHLERATKEMIEFSDKILFSTTIARDQIINLCGMKKSDKIHVKPQGTYFEKISDAEVEKQKHILIAKHPNLKDKRIVAGVGNTTQRKGFDVFLRTAVLMPELEFIWAGKKENYYDEVVKKYGVPSNFIYLGPMGTIELSGVYALSDIYLMCSRFDTLPSTIFEAQLFHVPVIGARNSGGIVDVVSNANGCLTEKVDEIEFAKAINEVLKRNMEIQSIDNSFSAYVKYVLDLF